MPVIEDNKTITITNYLDNQIVEPDDGYDALKQVTINVDIQPPAEHNIEENKQVTISTLFPSYRIIPSEGYDYMQEVNIQTRIRITNIDTGYVIGPPQFDPPLVVHDAHYFTDTIKQDKHPHTGRTVAKFDLRIGIRLANINGTVMYEVFLIFAAKGNISYYSEFNYRYLDVHTTREDWDKWRYHPWQFASDNNVFVYGISPYYIKYVFGKVVGVNDTLFKFYFETDKYYIPIMETEDIDIMSPENMNPELELIFPEEEENTQNESTNIQSQLSNMEIEEEN